MEKPRQAHVIIEYDGRDISDEIQQGLISFIYEDNTEECSEIKLVCEDKDGNWARSWYPRIGSLR